MEENQTAGSEQFRSPCAETCPYLLYGEALPDAADGVRAVGALCISDAELDYNLRAYQTRNCEGAQVWNDEAKTVYCAARSQVFGEHGEPVLRIRSEIKELELLRRHHAGRWALAEQDATMRFKRMVLGHIRDVATQVYSGEEIALARIDTHHEPFATKQSHPDLSDRERSDISEKMKRIKNASDAVEYYDRYWELARQGMSLRTILETILSDNAAVIKQDATACFQLELYQINKEWF